MICLNLGCGKDIKPSTNEEQWINIDIKDYGQEIVRDITRGLPFNNNSIDKIYASHFFEHLNGDDVRFVLEECWRVLKPNCEIYIRVPHSHCDEAFYPDHKSYWNEKMVEATINDPAQKSNYNFFILENQKIATELHIRLQKITS